MVILPFPLDISVPVPHMKPRRRSLDNFFCAAAICVVRKLVLQASQAFSTDVTKHFRRWYFVINNKGLVPEHAK
jgi:hypothetical protein